MNSIEQLYNLCKTLYRIYKPLSSLSSCTNESLNLLSSDQLSEFQKVNEYFTNLQNKKQQGGNNTLINIEKSLGLNSNKSKSIRNVSSTVQQNIISQEKETAKLLSNLNTFKLSLSESPSISPSISKSTIIKSTIIKSNIMKSNNIKSSICTLVILYFQKKIDIIKQCMKLLPQKINTNPCIIKIQKDKLKITSNIGKTYIKTINTCIRILNYIESKPVIKIKTLDYFITKLNDVFEILYEGCR